MLYLHVLEVHVAADEFSLWYPGAAVYTMLWLSQPPHNLVPTCLSQPLVASNAAAVQVLEDTYL